jgi:hypothetical protein
MNSMDAMDIIPASSALLMAADEINPKMISISFSDS